MVQAIRSMRTVLPEDAPRWQLVEKAMISRLGAFGYDEVRLPLLEFTELFSRGVGEATDIVEKEMYTLEDRDGESIALRPEGTAGCVRALNDAGLLFNQTQRVWYSGPMFRYERPQRGRYRQFYQIGTEAFGFAGPDIDVELILLARDCWVQLGIADHVQLELNTLGNREARLAYREALVDFLMPHVDELDEDSRRRLTTNPLRILDSKVDRTRELLVGAPNLPDFVDPESRAHFERLCELLTEQEVGFVVNPALVRGLDYYTHTVFEWTTEHIGAQSTICAGGRYDGLVETLGGRPTPAAGFGMGVDRVVLLHEAVYPDWSQQGVDVYCCLRSDAQLGWALSVTEALRLAGIRVRMHGGGGKLKNQFKRADASGARWALVIGEQEQQAREVAVKPLRGGEQQTMSVESLVSHIQQELGN